MASRRMFKWTIEIAVDQIWVEDGFNMQDDYIEHLQEGFIPWSAAGEVKVKVLTRPDEKEIRKVQGYKD